MLMLVQALAFDMRIAEVSCPNRYFEGASRISFRRAVVHSAGVLKTSVAHRLWRWGLVSPRIFSARPELKLLRPATVAQARA